MSKGGRTRSAKYVKKALGIKHHEALRLVDEMLDSGMTTRDIDGQYKNVVPADSDDCHRNGAPQQ